MADPEPKAVYQVQKKGLFSNELHVSDADGPVGVLKLERGRGMIVGGLWSPVKGEVLHMRRDPGLLRSQFSLWTDLREWLGSSLRQNVLHRDVRLHTGSRPLRLLPTTGFGSGWVLQAPKSGDLARFELSLFGNKDRIVQHRKMDFELLIFSYFLGIQLRKESFWPGPIEAASRSAARLAG